MHGYLTGYYAIRSDTIKIQFFIYQDQYWMRRNSLELIGMIKNDTTIELRRSSCHWCDKFYNITLPKSNSIDFEPPIEYRFVKDEQKPDSSRIWFRKKKWYLKRHNH